MLSKIKLLSTFAASLLLALSFGAQSAQANFIFNTGAVNTPANGPANGTATFDFLDANTLQLVLTNNLSGSAQGQDISTLNFTYSGFTITGLTSGKGNTINFQTSATVTADNILTSGDGNWAGTAVSSTSETVSALTGGQPSTLISGPNGSPNGNLKNFEPYVDTTATFLFSITGLTDTGGINTATFNFGTSAGEATFPGTPNSGNGRTPEPASLGLLSLGGLALLSRRRSAR